MSALSIIATLAFALAPAEDSASSGGFAAKDLAKAGKDVNDFFVALDKDDRGDQNESLDKLEAALGKLVSRARLDGHYLQYVDDWDMMLEFAKPDVRELKSAAGRGFVRHVFEDPWDPRRIATLVSVPPEYSRNSSLVPPAIVALKPSLGLTGDKLEDAVKATATRLYEPLLETHIVLVPLGPVMGEGRNQKQGEVEGSWLTDDGLFAFFTSFRTLLEQLRFDRKRVVLDGWNGAGLDALRLATSAPSFFGGLILRSDGVQGEDLIPENLFGVPVLYIQGAGDGDAADLAPLTSLEDKGVEVTVLEEAGSAMEPGAEVTTACHDWIGARRRDVAPREVRYKPGDARFASAAWCRAVQPNRRATARPEDVDFPRIHAVIDRETNTIEVDTVNVLELEVFLSDALLDLDKDVTIRVNGEEKFKKPVNRSLRFLLENRFFNNSGDYGVYTARVLIEDIEANVPGRSQ